MTMLVVSHEMGFARQVANRMVLMDAGQIVEVNEPEAFFDAPAARADQAVPEPDSALSRCGRALACAEGRKQGNQRCRLRPFARLARISQHRNAGGYHERHGQRVCLIAASAVNLKFLSVAAARLVIGTSNSKPH